MALFEPDSNIYPELLLGQFIPVFILASIVFSLNRSFFFLTLIPWYFYFSAQSQRMTMSPFSALVLVTSERGGCVCGRVGMQGRCWLCSGGWGCWDDQSRGGTAAASLTLAAPHLQERQPKSLQSLGLPLSFSVPTLFSFKLLYFLPSGK